MQPQYDLTGSIVLYKNDEIVEKAIQSFLSTSLKIKLYLIDNSPTDELKNVLHSYLTDARVTYLFNNKNIGFGAGHNVAIRKTIDSSNYHLVFNPDIYFEENVLEQIIEYLNKQQNVGALMPKILYENGHLQYLAKLLPTPFDFFIRRFFPFAFKRIQDKFILKNSNYDKVINVPFLSGCFLILNTKALKEVGLFDEKIFMYTEDIDITRRILSFYKTIFFPNVHVFHVHKKKSFRNLNVLKSYLKSAIYYFNKWGWFYDNQRKKINKQTLSQFL